MDAMAPFRISIASLKADESNYHWELNQDFLKLFDDEHDTEKGQFTVSLTLQRSGTVTTMNFDITGMVETNCDRCTAPINLPLEGNYEIIVKFGDATQTTDEVIFVDPESNGLNVGQLIYDFILLSIPFSRRIPGCETLSSPPCDMTVLNYLSETKAENKARDDTDSLWEDLKKITDN
jgi:uncharacterized metal-binding protein YceD (DUF177 family)